MTAIDLFLSDPGLQTGFCLEENRRQGDVTQAVTLGQLVAVQELDLATEVCDELLPLVAHAESGMREGAEIAGIGLGRNDLVADVEQRIHQPTVGVVHENQRWFAHSQDEIGGDTNSFQMTRLSFSAKDKELR